MTISKIAAALLVLVVGFAAFLIVNFIHFRFFPVHVVLYDSILDLCIAVALMIPLLGVLKFATRRLTRFEIALTLCVLFLTGSLYAILVPTVIDRSLSIYFLEKLDQRGGGIRRDAWNDIIKDEFFREHRIADIRLTEQINSGTIKLVGDCTVLTPLGMAVVAYTRYFRTHFLPRRREIMGTLTDDLTDPFRHSVAAPPYTCKGE